MRDVGICEGWEHGERGIERGERATAIERRVKYLEKKIQGASPTGNLFLKENASSFPHRTRFV